MSCIPKVKLALCMAYFIFSIYLFVMVGRPQDYLTFLQPLRPALFLGVLSALAFVFSKRGLRQLNEALRLSESRKYLFFYGIMIIGIPFALYRKQAFDFTFQTYWNNILFFFIFLVANDSFDRFVKSLSVVILSALTYAIFCLSEGSLSEGRFYSGTMFDPNDLAYFFVSLLPLPLYYIIHNKGRIRQGIGLITFVASILIIILTGSRAGIISLMITFITIAIMIKLELKKKIFIMSVLIAISAMYYYRINIDRYSTLLNIEEDYNITEETGRLTVWKRSIQISLAHPIIGVGAACFGEAIGTIRQEMGLPQARWQAAHNSYLQVACELGLIGLFLFLSIIFGCLKHFYILYRARGQDEFGIELQTISRLLSISTIATLSAGFFISQGYSMIFTLLFAFSGALRYLNKKVIETVEDI